MTKILTLAHAHKQCNKRDEAFPGPYKGIAFDRRGRAVAPFVPNLKGLRYEKGKYVPRKRA